MPNGRRIIQEYLWDDSISMNEQKGKTNPQRKNSNCSLWRGQNWELTVKELSGLKVMFSYLLGTGVNQVHALVTIH